MVDRIRRVEKKTGRPIGILADLQGPKLRVGRFAGGSVVLQWGRTLPPRPAGAARATASACSCRILRSWPRPGPARCCCWTTAGPPGGRPARRRSSWTPASIVGGRLSDHKGVNLPGLVLPIPALTTKDRSDLAFALEHGCDWIGLSFVQRPEDVAEARELVGDRAFILSKIEKPGALQSIDEVLRLSDAIMVARGDLGVELPAEDVPLIQKRLIRAAHRYGRPVVVATQMMESMIENPTPTRAEASDVATAVFDGADAVMLSAESATGKYPVETVRMMDRIIARTEDDDDLKAARAAMRPDAGEVGRRRHLRRRAPGGRDHRGQGDRRLLALRPHRACASPASGRTAPILGLTPSLETARRLALVWGVHALHLRDHAHHDRDGGPGRDAGAEERLRQAARRDRGDRRRAVRPSGGTNSLRVAKVT